MTPRDSAPPVAAPLALKGLVVAAPPEDRDIEYRPLRWPVIKRLLGYIWRHRPLQIALIGQAVVLAALYAAGPLIISETIRRTIESPQTWRNATGLEPAAGAWIGAGLLALVALAFYGMNSARIRAVNRLGEAVVYDIRRDVFDHIQTLDMAFFDRTKLGRILARGTSDVNNVRNAVVHVIPRTTIDVLKSLFLVAMMLHFDWVLTLIVLAATPVVVFGNTYFDRWLTQSYRRVQESFSRLTAALAETVSGIRVTQAFAREDINAALFKDLCLDHRRNNMINAHIGGLYWPALDIMFSLAALVVIVVGAWRLEHGHMTTADMIGFLLAIGGFFASLSIIADMYNITLQAMAAGERVFALLDTKPSIADHPGAEPLPRTGSGARIEFRDVGFGYTPDRPVLHGISFVAEPGQTVALVGHTGSGKTSIVGLICRLYAHQSGQILVDGRPIQDVTIASLHDQTGLVLQDNFLFTGTVMDNIRFGRPGASDAEVLEACRTLDCLDIFEGLSQGLQTDVGERGGGLSLGQRQLVTFARAMLADPRILMLDEATSAVDTFTEHRIQLALEKLMRGRTCIVVAHRLSTVRMADQILMLDHGRIIERGTHGSLVQADGAYARLYTEFVRLTSEG